MNEELLFGEPRLHEVMRSQTLEMVEEINRLTSDQILNVSVDDLCDIFEQNYWLHIPVLHRDEIEMEFEDATRDRTDRFDRAPYKVMGTLFTFYVPYEGDPDLFRFSPSTWSMNPPRAEIREGMLVLRYFQPSSGSSHPERQSDAVRRNLDSDLDQIQTHLDRAANDVVDYHASLRSTAQRQIEFRRDKYLQDNRMAAHLGFPLRRRSDASQTYMVPTVRRKVLRLPLASKAPFVPEPALEMQQYEEILSAIQHMALVMERSPSAFQAMDEETLRHQFLVPLNGLFAGQATGETFNYEGKTDILIRAEGRNVFVAECKFWDGPQKLTETIDQLLGYTSWRDTKTAILIFSRNKNFSSVLAQIPEVIRAHSNCKRVISTSGETQFRYVFRHRDDPNRELTLTVMAFNIPKEE